MKRARSTPKSERGHRRRAPRRAMGPWFWPVVVLALALALRAVYIAQIRHTPFFQSLGLDAKFYDRWAHEIAAGRQGEPQAFFMSPLYPYFLAAVYRFFGRDLLLVRVVQAVIGSLSAGLACLVGTLAYDRRVGIISGILLAAYGAFIFYDGSILLAPFLVCLNLLALFLLLKADVARAPYGFLAAGAALGLAAVGKPTALAFVPLALLWIWAGRPEERVRPVGPPVSIPARPVLRGARRDSATERPPSDDPGGGGLRRTGGSTSHRAGSLSRLAMAGMFLLGVILIVAPITARNFAVSGDFVLITSNGGLNFYIGNSEISTGGYVKPNGLDIVSDPDGAMIAQEVRGRKLGPSEVSAYWYALAREYIRSNAGPWARLMVRKLSFAMSSYELPQLENYYFQKRYSSLLSLPLPAFGLVAPLGLLGMALSWRRRRVRLLIAFFIVYMLSIVAFFVVARYRAAAIPPLLIAGSFALVRLYEWLRARAWRKLALSVGALVAFSFVVNYNFYGIDRAKSFAQPHFRLGIIYSERGMAGRAIEEYRKAIGIDPGYPKSHVNLGVMLSEEGSHQAAESAFREAIRLDPGYTMARLNLALALEREGRFEAAFAEIDTVLRVEPNNAAALKQAGIVRYRQGRPDEAEALLERALVKDIDGEEDSEIRFYLGLIRRPAPSRAGEAAQRAIARGDSLSIEGRVIEAMEAYEEASRISPGAGQPLRRMALLKRRLGLVEEAVGLMRAALRADPTLPHGHFETGVLLNELGRHEEARREYEAELRMDPGFGPAHLNLGLLYQFHVGNANLAEYHYRKYLDLGGERSEEVEEFIRKLGLAE